MYLLNTPPFLFACLQYMVIIANLRVSWPVTISYPSKALTVGEEVGG
jgi:hypothetical protein